MKFHPVSASIKMRSPYRGEITSMHGEIGVSDGPATADQRIERSQDNQWADIVGPFGKEHRKVVG
jgi:hypothetical protein